MECSMHYRADVSKHDPSPIIISKYLSEPGPTRLSSNTQVHITDMHSPPHDPHPASYPQCDRRVCDHDHHCCWTRWLLVCAGLPPSPLPSPRCKSFCSVCNH